MFKHIFRYLLFIVLFHVADTLVKGQSLDKIQSSKFILPITKSDEVEYSKSTLYPIPSDFLDSNFTLNFKSVPSFREELTVIFSKSINNGNYIEIHFQKHLNQSNKKHGVKRKKLKQTDLEQLEKILIDYHYRKSGASIITKIQEDGSRDKIFFTDGTMHFGKLNNKYQLKHFKFHQGSASIDNKNKIFLETIGALCKKYFHRSKAIDHINYIFNYDPY